MSLFIVMLTLIMLKVANKPCMLTGIMLSVVKLRVVVVLSVVMLNVVAPLDGP